MQEVRSIKVKDLTVCSCCSHAGSCARCPGLAYVEGSMRGRSSSDCEKSYHRTGIPSANLLRKAGLASGGPLIWIQPIPRKNSTSQRHFPRNGHLFPGRDYFSDLPGTDLCLQTVQSLA